jgi:hypothetical protein
LRLWCVCALLLVAEVAVMAEEVGKGIGIKTVELIGERVDVAFAKKGVVGEGFVDEGVEEVASALMFET